MATQADLILADGQATPVNKTFRARGVNGTLATYRETSSGFASSYQALTIDSKTSPAPNGSQKVQVRLTIPVMEVPSGGTDTGYQAAPKVAFNVFFRADVTLPNRCSQQNRKDVLAYVKNLFSNALMTEIVVNDNPPT